ncbi:flavin reductase family protein [Streptomyces peucetius]|uniref:Flavin reductase family protein n=1 Tax=Streptomyces peucetius TaxID=1950 RepID=A0ABY6I3U9_STRPE|nr:flavin reductase family protein [Streptomyces peucetius]UYQ60557.1 flavin reductase family protein [Streptomyces peucetius]
MVSVARFTALLDPPVYIVTAAADGQRAGCLVGFASQSSLDPVRFVVWLSKVNHTYRVARHAPFLGVHLLHRDRTEVARLFGGETGDRVDKFARARWEPRGEGVPVLGDACAWFIGRVEERADWGDHVGFCLTPVDGSAESLPRGSLLTLGDVTDLRPGHPAP